MIENPVFGDVFEMLVMVAPILGSLIFFIVTYKDKDLSVLKVIIILFLTAITLALLAWLSMKGLTAEDGVLNFIIQIFIAFCQLGIFVAIGGMVGSLSGRIFYAVQKL